MSRAKRTEARQLWLHGELADQEIAKRIGITAETLAHWRDDESWPALRDLIDVRAAAKRSRASDDADATSLLLVDVVDNLASKLMSKSAGSMSAQDLQRLTAALKSSREIRRDIERTKGMREQREKK